VPGSLPENVRAERNGWRDGAISARHRHWGFNCPAVDLDFLVVEYNVGRPVGLIEYKHFKARPPDFLHATYRALATLADGYNEPLPFLVAFYWPDIWAFRILPANDYARQHFQQGEVLCEREFVTRLYRLRRLTLKRHLENSLNTALPHGFKLNGAAPTPGQMGLEL